MPPRIKMPERAPDIRNKDFKQVNTGYTAEESVAEAKRCLQCPNSSCVKGCPVEINIPGFIKKLAEGNAPAAIEILKEKNNLPAVCGRVCPQETQCEKHCILAKKGESIAIGNLERYAADFKLQSLPHCSGEAAKAEKNSQFSTLNSKLPLKVAVVGSGPAGLACAGDLAKLGYDVTVFESLHDTGGVLRYGIPEFRLPKKVLDSEIDYLKNLGVRFVLNTLIGRTKTVKRLFDEGYKAVFVGVGAGLPIFLGVEGENLNHVYSANEFLVRVNLMRAYEFPKYDTPVYKGKNVVVVGGGNTAMDSARTALRLGAQSVKLVYRRSENEMPARLEERIHAKEEGVEFITLTNPVKFIAGQNRCVAGAECVKMELGEPDASGRRRPKKIENSNFIIESDMVVLALGLNPNPVLASLTDGLNTDKDGYIEIDENFMTSLNGVFAGGDIAGGDTVIQAMGMGKKSAKNIHEYLQRFL
ncbi:NADPH-dependent glutamate synthase [Endomicrobium proavitum]|nr:NADPH-dependent glutamate synthase [Endomicrobium proavitum]